MKAKLFSLLVILVMLACVKGFAQDGDDKVVGRATEKAESMKAQFSLTDAQYKSLYDLFYDKSDFFGSSVFNS